MLRNRAYRRPWRRGRAKVSALPVRFETALVALRRLALRITPHAASASGHDHAEKAECERTIR
jgi:hypothetical protein